MSLFKRFPLVTAIVGAALVLVVAQGCGDSGNDNVAPPDVNGGNDSTGGTKGNAGSKNNGGSAGNSTGNVGGDDGGAPSSTGGTGGKGGTTSNDAGTGNEGGADNPPIPVCDKPETGANGCFNCPKDKEVEQWLNRCVEGDCVPFNNKARLPKLNADGSVPKLPN